MLLTSGADMPAVAMPGASQLPPAKITHQQQAKACYKISKAI
jgi:hypothetical protein